MTLLTPASPIASKKADTKAKAFKRIIYIFYTKTTSSLEVPEELFSSTPSSFFVCGGVYFKKCTVKTVIIFRDGSCSSILLVIVLFVLNSSAIVCSNCENVV